MHRDPWLCRHFLLDADVELLVYLIFSPLRLQLVLKDIGATVRLPEWQRNGGDLTTTIEPQDFARALQTLEANEPDVPGAEDWWPRKHDLAEVCSLAFETTELDSFQERLARFINEDSTIDEPTFEAEFAGSEVVRAAFAARELIERYWQIISLVAVVDLIRPRLAFEAGATKDQALEQLRRAEEVNRFLHGRSSQEPIS